MSALTIDGTGFTRFAMLYLDEAGRFIDNTREDDISTVAADELPQFLRKIISSEVLPPDTTDVFVWVHGWQNDELRAIATARKLFANLDDWFKSQASNYPGSGKIVPAFVAVHWPSTSLPGPVGYRKIRNRAKAMTDQGEAEFFVASLLGYLDATNERAVERKVLRAKGGYFVHCLGHSFGGRFLTAAIKAAATPEASERKVLTAKRATGFPFNVDSLCVLQMAAGATAFGSEFSSLLGTSPLCGPIILTHSTNDKALCRWHFLAEGEVGIGCQGAGAPAGHLGQTVLKAPNENYSSADFSRDITNVDASDLFINGGWAEGGHSDFWYTHTMHLIASIVQQVRG